jgi:hypothetical protein
MQLSYMMTYKLQGEAAEMSATDYCDTLEQVEKNKKMMEEEGFTFEAFVSTEEKAPWNWRPLDLNQGEPI